jgi:hypothetical protein
MARNVSTGGQSRPEGEEHEFPAPTGFQGQRTGNHGIMEQQDPERREDETTPRERRREQDEQTRPKRRLRWLRDVEVKRSVNAAVQDDDFDR